MAKTACRRCPAVEPILDDFLKGDPGLASMVRLSAAKLSLEVKQSVRKTGVSQQDFEAHLDWVARFLQSRFEFQIKGDPKQWGWTLLHNGQSSIEEFPNVPQDELIDRIKRRFNCEERHLPNTPEVRPIHQLMAAIANGDESTIAQVVADNPGMDVDARIDGVRTPLLALIEGGTPSPSMVTALINAGADPLKTTSSGRSVLRIAIESSQPIDVFKALIDGGADVNARSGKVFGVPLHYLAISDSPHEIVDLLIEEGADPTITDVDNETPIDWARRSGRSDVIERIDRMQSCQAKKALDNLARDPGCQVPFLPDKTAFDQSAQ